MTLTIVFELVIRDSLGAIGSADIASPDPMTVLGGAVRQWGEEREFYNEQI